MFFQQHSSYKSLDPSVTRRYFYSIKDISIGGQCICYGHASYCRRHDNYPDRLQCQCLHNTGGDNCEQCLPLFNQRPWRTGGIQGLGCEACNCHGKAAECVYNATVDAKGLSLNMQGEYKGGGVCLNCQEFTTGVNCERCADGYYRPQGYSPSSPRPCRPCSCQETATSTAQCVLDDSRVSEGLNPGDCICKPGFGGPSCQECAFGYHGYPNCQRCPCNPAGTQDSSSCRQPCVCKPNVGGAECGQCRPGFFNLDRNNAEGCTQCFCFGVTTQCKSANWGLKQITDLNSWVLSTLEDGGGLTLLPRFFDGWLEAKTYLLNTNTINVNLDPAAAGSGSRYTPSSEVHYWLAPMVYLGNRLSSYGGHLKYTVKFTLDSSLTNRNHLPDPDVILKGGGMTLAHGRLYRREDQEHRVSVHLVEGGWYHLTTRQPVSRRDFMTALYSLQQLMIKATYHTAQDTVYLRDVSLDVASPLEMTNRTLPSVEQCQCPEGYAGLSCESCSPGWRRVNSQLYKGVCERCTCNNHAAECDPGTGACQACKHNTAGDNCERCMPGFYGDPQRGTENDCQPCACPLMTGNNFFAESCRAIHPSPSNGTAYQCINCQQGYEGSHCERCSPGYYGDPTQPGGLCRKCNCGGSLDPSAPAACDRVTGKCSVCASNMEGEFCERCRPGFFGSAVNGDCRPCECNPRGSYSNTCDQRTGQCSCHPRLLGRQCDRCEPGYGDISQGCVRCSCSLSGSLSHDCDPVTGRCHCRPGIGGQHCDRCAEGFFGFTQNGCQRCDCYTPGTNPVTQCDPRSGRCLCQPNVIGRRCDQCQMGYYGIEGGQGCLECTCDQVGSTSYECDRRFGQCSCRPGVGGRACDQCLPGYFGLSMEGCRRCEPCTKPGHMCDPNTGECVCPPNTVGPHCDRCQTEAFDYDSMKGCKANVEGDQCDKCAPGSFSLRAENPKGCTECYCFHRSQQCTQAPYVWGKVKVPTQLVSLSPQGAPPPAMDGVGHLATNSSSSRLSVPADQTSPQGAPPVVDHKGYLVINSSHLSVPAHLTAYPLFWSLPAALLGDRTRSYSGRLDFIHYFDKAGSRSSDTVSPFVVLRGNTFELHGDVNSLEPNHAESFSIRLHESFWKLPGQQMPVSRPLMMVVLQNVTAILVRATQDGQATYAEIGPISLEVAQPAQNTSGAEEDSIAYGVEQCVCPERYSGLSCQNPAEGYYRVRPNSQHDPNAPETAIGHVRPCQCYSHSNSCHPETGVCENCAHNTTGMHCEQCAPGYYGMATRGTPYDCAPCACPLQEPSNNFSPTCSGVGSSLMCTNCSQGYTGTRCERCEDGYYGNPAQLGEKCTPCLCNPEGSVDKTCDRVTGQCRCRPGIQGQRCNKCSDPRQGVQNGTCVSCYQGCTGELLNDLKNLTIPDAYVNISGVIYPWEELYRMANDTQDLRARMDALQSTSLDNLKDMKGQADFYRNIADKLDNRLDFTNSRVSAVREKTNETMLNATEVENVVDELLKEIKGNISQLRQLVEKLYYNQTGINVSAAVIKARRILSIILARDFTDADNNARQEGWLAEKLSERIKNMRKELVNTTGVAQALGSVLDSLRDLHDRSATAKDQALEILDEYSQQLGTLIADLQDKLLDIEDMKELAENMLKEGRELNSEAEKAVTRLNKNILVLQNELSVLNTAKAELEKRFNVLRNAMPGLEQNYRDAWRHALDLERMATHLADLFEKVRSLAEDPMRAAQAYQQIVQLINQAEAAVRKALKTAQDSVKIAMVDDLADEVQRSVQRSRDLLKQADQLLDTGVRDLSDKLRVVRRDVDDVQRQHQSAIDLLNMLRAGLNTMPKGFGTRLREILRKIDLAVDRANAANMTVTNIQYGIDTLLLPRLKQLQDFDINAIIYNVRSNTEDAGRGAQYIRANLPAAKDGIQRNLRNQLTISNKIRDLRRKIDEARNITNSMKMSLSGEGKCARSYRSELGPGVTNEIRLAFKVNRTGVDMLLLLLQESSQEYMALEVKDNKVRFSWNVGKGPGSVTHNLELKVFDPSKDEAEKWYRILAKRAGPVGQLKVWPIKDTEAVATEVSGKSDSGFSLMNFNRNTSIYLAGVDDAHKTPVGVTRGKLYGCVGDVTVDKKPIGVYNFKTSHGQCNASKNVPQRQPSSRVYTFNGHGYATMPITAFNYRSDRFTITLEFKTFWENSRLYFAGKPEEGDFVSIDLVGGKIMVQMYYGGTSIARVESSLAYNTNKWTNINLQRNKLDALLQIFVDTHKEEEKFFSASGPNSGLELMGESMYIGGLPESYDLDKFPRKDVKDTKNFLGCLKNIGVGPSSAIPVDLTEGVQVGIRPGCLDKNINHVGFYGNGFVLFDGVGLDQPQADISLSFFTKQPDALLLLAKDIASDHFYSIALTGGRLEARLAANSPRVSLSSSQTYNDGAIHYVSLFKEDTTLRMLVDDIEVAKGQLPFGVTGIPLSANSNLYFGGAQIIVNDMAASDVKLDGCISDIIANGRLIDLAQAKQYKLADIGRCGESITNANGGTPTSICDNSNLNRPTPNLPSGIITVGPVTVPPVRPTAGSPQTSTCSPFRLMTAGIEGNAKTLGNSEKSFAKISKNINLSELRKNFNISFEFRTFFEDGLFGLLKNADQSVYFAVQLRGGRMEVVYSYKGAQREMWSSLDLTDGLWHSAQVIKDQTQLRMFVDGRQEGSDSIESRLEVDLPFYIGGLSGDEELKVNVVDHSLRGCVRNLNLGGNPVDITDTDIIKGVEYCYVDVQRGVGFTGGSWGVYDLRFDVGVGVLIKAEFKSSERDGVLVTITDTTSNSGLTLELHEGKMKLTLKNDEGTLQVESTNIDLSAYCMRQWHTVEAQFAASSLRLKLDGQPDVFATSPSGSLTTPSKAPLLIGGAPSFFGNQIASSSNRGMYGCMRNVFINGNQVDWYMLNPSGSLLRTACPL
ncbi:laminin subunit alpha-2-like isoform X2 [Babylonia areolata]|uniref:laminin subunit alpha-2-like isoform X2 n=1 Tax=Babylonia areolata TaxID=304850 RepID=UPI003FD16569